MVKIFQNFLPEVVAVMKRTGVHAKKKKKRLCTSKGQGRGLEYINKIDKYIFPREKLHLGIFIV